MAENADEIMDELERRGRIRRVGRYNRRMSVQAQARPDRLELVQIPPDSRSDQASIHDELSEQPDQESQASEERENEVAEILEAQVQNQAAERANQRNQ